MRNKIAERLKSLMDEERISAYKLAKDLSVSQSVVGYWLKEKTSPNADYIVALCEYFGISADYLLGLKDY